MPFPKWFNELGQRVHIEPYHVFAKDEVNEILSEAERRIQSAESSLRYFRNLTERQQEAFRKTLQLSYDLEYPISPTLLILIADDIDCGGECDTVWREHDTNASGCSKEEEDECPFANAAALRELARTIINQRWVLAFNNPWNPPERRRL